MDKRNFRYIFVIGFNRTATTSIHKLFEESGFKSIHWDNGNLAKSMLENIIKGKKILCGYDDKYIVFSDMFYRTRNFIFEGNSLFRQLDIEYPNSIFIYNKRSIKDWLLSRANHNSIIDGYSIFELEKRINNFSSNNEVLKKWARDRKLFESEIRKYFHGRSQLIEIDINEIDFVKNISEFCGIKLDRTKWKKYNFSR